MTIWFASGNINKKKELADILTESFLFQYFDLKLPSDAGLNFNPDETGSSFLENALIKAEALYRLFEENHSKKNSFSWQSGEPIISDDSGICVDALDGRPGIHSSLYCGPGVPLGASGKLPDAERNALLLSELGDTPLRSARFV